jgi:cation diffusion facilitator family transporter
MGENADKRKAGAALLSVISNSALVLLKLVVGFVIGSISVMSEAIHSAVDLLAALIALFAVKKSGKPADKEHPFGHGKVENISGAVEATLIFAAAGWIIFEAVKKLRHPAPIDEPGWGVAVMLLSAVVNTGVSQFLLKVGRETESVALEADAWHLRTDVYTSAGVMVGLGLIWLSERAFPGMHFHWIDPVAAIGVALLIIKAAYDLTIKSARDLLDESLPAEEIELIRAHIQEFTPKVRGFHGLRTRRSGSQRFVDFHMLVDADMSVDSSHEISDRITEAIKEHYPQTTVTVHIEPCHGDCLPECQDECLLSEDDRRKARKDRS